MARNFNLPPGIKLKDPRVAARLVLGVLVTANIAAALIAFKPWGGSAEDLARQQRAMQQQITQLQAKLARSKSLVAKAELARKEGDQFLAKYVTDRRSTMSILAEELAQTAKQAGVTDKGISVNLEPVDGSDTLVQMTIAAVYEGDYPSLTKLVNLLDKSPRFLIIESMVATPQQSGKTASKITVSFKLDTFVREQPGSAT